MAASRGSEQSQELRSEGHGLFTYSLLAALNGDSDSDKDGRKTVREVFEYSLPIVENLRRKDRPQSPRLVTAAPLGGMVLSVD